MPHWILKAAVQRGISALPGAHLWNELLQTYVTRSLDLSAERFETRLNHCRAHLEALRRFGIAKDEFTAFELGTGWHPVVAVGLFLCGASRVWTCDIAPLLRRKRVLDVLRSFVTYHERGDLKDFLPEVIPRRIDQVRDAVSVAAETTPSELLGQFKITVLVRDARRTDLPTGAADLIFSTAVMEYLSPEVLSGILAEFHRLARSSAVLSHRIDMRDEYAYFDRRLSPFNFLRFSDRSWRRLNNPLIPLNRLRISDYRRSFQSAGFEILDEKNRCGRPEDLQRVPLATRFRAYAPEDLLVFHTHLVAGHNHRRTGAAAGSIGGLTPPVDLTSTMEEC